jgi:hypothetical protein
MSSIKGNRSVEVEINLKYAILKKWPISLQDIHPKHNINNTRVIITKLNTNFILFTVQNYVYLCLLNYHITIISLEYLITCWILSFSYCLSNTGGQGQLSPYGLVGSGIESRWGGGVLPRTSRPDLGPTQPSLQVALGLFPRDKAAGAWHDHPPNLVPSLKKE